MPKIDWNIANILTMFRIVLVPVIIILILINSPLSLIFAVILFFISSITDILDGYLARRLSLQSDFGAYWDPLADKILTLGVYTVLIFIPELHIYWWLVLILYFRDISVTLIRNYFTSKDYSFTTSRIAKAKTVIQMLVLGLILFYMMISRIQISRLDLADPTLQEVWSRLIGNNASIIIYGPFILTLIVVVFTIYSSIQYYYELIQLVKKEK